MDLGAIKGEDLHFLHQAFITDTVANALSIIATEVRLYHSDLQEQKRFIAMIDDHLCKKLNGAKAQGLKDRFTTHELSHEGWGNRIEKVFKDCFSQGYSSVLVIGSRTPTITPKMMKTALKMLKECDAVFGPTPEGRYYIIGMSGSAQINLSELDWTSPSVYHDVAAAFTQKHLTWSELEIWYAVESADELEFLARDINQYRFEGDEETARETEAVMERIIARM
ncbi:MAG: DUF2064 domain-containing protein [candidate division Zixibacteria bacterium]|nr:DUF2064 domain-containing protein [candidate division Zixibacteria bacterium]